ncbi:hypothetical protein FOA52_013035 [Chlamydomonas sp. UWO 241]|nr:hypothetical protein FOA52_013035 [Chlamydomonas sp. UWO 241]
MSERAERRQVQEQQRALKAASRMGPRAATLLLARHGETEWNVSHRLQGQDMHVPGLNAAGHAQAAQLAAHFVAEASANRVPDAIYSSDLARAMDTACAVAAALGMEVLQVPALRERHLGVLQGLTPTEAAVSEPDALRMLRSGGEMPGGGESVPQLRSRAAAAALSIARAHPGGCVLLVSHGGWLNALHSVAAAGGGSSGGRVLNASISTKASCTRPQRRALSLGATYTSTTPWPAFVWARAQVREEESEPMEREQRTRVRVNGIAEDALAPTGGHNEFTDKIKGLTLRTEKGDVGTASYHGEGACGGAGSSCGGGTSLPTTLTGSSDGERGDAHRPSAPDFVHKPSVPAAAPAPAPALTVRLREGSGRFVVDPRVVAAVLTFLWRNGPTSETAMGRALGHPKCVQTALRSMMNVMVRVHCDGRTPPDDAYRLMKPGNEAAAALGRAGDAMVGHDWTGGTGDPYVWSLPAQAAAAAL